VLLIRPADVFPPLYGLPIYQGCILFCLAVALPAVSRMLGREGLAAEPISLCIVGLLGAVALSHLSHGRIGEAVSESCEFAKLLIYHVLLVSLVNTPRRLRVFLWCLSALIVAHTALAVMQYHGMVDLPAMAAMPEAYFDPESDEWTTKVRLCGGGIFGNPNDLSRILAVGMFLALYWLGDRGAPGPVRLRPDSDLLARGLHRPDRRPARPLSGGLRHTKSPPGERGRAAGAVGPVCRATDGHLDERGDRPTANPILESGVRRHAGLAGIRSRLEPV
jgi:hypothetical protein